MCIHILVKGLLSWIFCAPSSGKKSGPLDIWNWTECISCEISGTQRALLRPAWPWLFFSIQEPQNYEEMSFGALKITRYIYCLFHFFLLDLICLAQERERALPILDGLLDFVF